MTTRLYGPWLYTLAIGAASLSSLLGACNTQKAGESPTSAISAALVSKDDKLPKRLKNTKLFQDGDPLRPMPGVLPYDVKLPLWSDGARKRRYAFIPPGKTVTLDPATGALDFPVGATFIKHFTTGNDPELPIETRLITRKDDGHWSFVTYVWNDDGTTEANERPHKVTKGGAEYRIPSEQECKLCHGDSTGGTKILGFSLKQLNFAPKDQENQLVAMVKGGLFSGNAEDLTRFKALDDPADTSLSVNARTRAYMDVNCGTCHNPTGPDKANAMDMRLDAADTRLLTEGKIVPGSPADSILFQKTSSEMDRMPLISLRVDAQGVDLFKQFIEQWPK